MNKNVNYSEAPMIFKPNTRKGSLIEFTPPSEMGYTEEEDGYMLFKTIEESLYPKIYMEYIKGKEQFIRYKKMENTETDLIVEPVHAPLSVLAYGGYITAITRVYMSRINNAIHGFVYSVCSDLRYYFYHIHKNDGIDFNIDNDNYQNAIQMIISQCNIKQGQIEDLITSIICTNPINALLIEDAIQFIKSCIMVEIVNIVYDGCIHNIVFPCIYNNPNLLSINPKVKDMCYTEVYVQLSTIINNRNQHLFLEILQTMEDVKDQYLQNSRWVPQDGKNKEIDVNIPYTEPCV